MLMDTSKNVTRQIEQNCWHCSAAKHIPRNAYAVREKSVAALCSRLEMNLCCVCTCWHDRMKILKTRRSWAIGDETVNVAAFSREWAREFVEYRRISMVGPVASGTRSRGWECRSIAKRIDVDVVKEFLVWGKALLNPRKVDTKIIFTPWSYAVRFYFIFLGFEKNYLN